MTALEPTSPRAGLDELRAAARRTRLLRGFLAAAVAGSIAVATWASSAGQTTHTTLLPSGSNGIVVLDLSASISSDTFARIGATLGQLAGSSGRYGLILFSDTAYQALPPGTPATELRPFERYFVVPKQTTPGLAPALPKSPWSASFSAGTRISAGLQLALDVIERDHLRKTAVLLVSDLDDDSGDLESLTAVGLTLRHSGIPVRVIGLNPAPEDARLVRRLLPHGGDLVQARLPGEHGSLVAAPFPTRLVALICAVAAVLAAFVLCATRLRWSPR